MVVTFEESQVAQVAQVPDYVRPGQSIELTVALRAPLQPGLYQAFASLRNAEVSCSISDRSDDLLKLYKWKLYHIPVGVVLDFARDYCAATWRSGSGVVPCVQVEK